MLSKYKPRYSFFFEDMNKEELKRELKYCKDKVKLNLHPQSLQGLYQREFNKVFIKEIEFHLNKNKEVK